MPGKAKPKPKPKTSKAKVKPVRQTKPPAKSGMKSSKSRPPLMPEPDGVVRLSGGNPQIAKADGDAPVQAYIAAVPDWRRDVARRIDAVITREVPQVRKAVKWNSPFYGLDGQGWFASVHVFTNYVKVTFFAGTSLRPVPPGGTPKSREARWVDVRQGALDEARLTTWVKQAAELPGWNGR